MTSGVAFVQGGFAPYGGIESFATDLLVALQRRGLQAGLICWDGSSPRVNPALSELARSGVRVYRSGWRWGCRWGWPDKVLARHAWERMLDADVLIFGKLLHESIYRRLNRCGKRMLFVTPYRPAEMWAARRPDEAILNSFDCVVVQTDDFAADMRDFGYRGRVAVMPYIPPPSERAAAWPSPAPIRIGFLGRLVPQKNLTYLLEAFCAVRRKGMDAELHFFGAGPEEGTLLAKAAQMDVLQHVCFHGSKPHGEIPRKIDSCHMFAFTSISEGQCLAALEIFARGRPVVATPVGAFPEFLADGELGVLSVPDQAEEFARSLAVFAWKIKKNALTPDDVQSAYRNRFPREKVIQEYIDLLSGRRVSSGGLVH